MRYCKRAVLSLAEGPGGVGCVSGLGWAGWRLGVAWVGAGSAWAVEGWLGERGGLEMKGQEVKGRESVVVLFSGLKGQWSQTLSESIKTINNGYGESVVLKGQGHRHS